MKVKRVKKLLIYKCCNFEEKHSRYQIPSCICSMSILVYANHQMSASNSLVQVEFPMNALSEF